MYLNGTHNHAGRTRNTAIGDCGEADDSVNCQKVKGLPTEVAASLGHYTPLRQPRSFSGLTSIVMEPSEFTGCSHAQATGFIMPGRTSSLAERWRGPV